MITDFDRFRFSYRYARQVLGMNLYRALRFSVVFNKGGANIWRRKLLLKMLHIDAFEDILISANNDLLGLQTLLRYTRMLINELSPREGDCILVNKAFIKLDRAVGEARQIADKIDRMKTLLLSIRRGTIAFDKEEDHDSN